MNWGEDITISQIKEKFGTLRFYIYGGSDAIDKLIDTAEDLSSVTCEQCGQSGELRDNGWLFTLCDECWDKKLKEEKL